MPGEIVTRTGRLWLDAAYDVVRFVCLPGSTQALADARENVAALMRISEGRRYPFLCDLTESRPLSPEARAFYASDEARASFRALALLSGSTTGKMIANIFLAKYARTGSPIRMFTREGEALAWLREHAG